MTIFDIEDQDILVAILSIMTPEEIYWGLPKDDQESIRTEIANRFNIKFDEDE